MIELGAAGVRVERAPRSEVYEAQFEVARVYKLSVADRRRVAAKLGDGRLRLWLRWVTVGSAASARQDPRERVGTFSLPFALALNVQVNGEDFIAPMVVEEPSVVAAASNAARMVREGGGFTAEADEPIMIAQVQLDDVPDLPNACLRIKQNASELIALGNAAVRSLCARGGGVRGIEPAISAKGCWRTPVCRLPRRDGRQPGEPRGEAVADRIAE